MVRMAGLLRVLLLACLAAYLTTAAWFVCDPRPLAVPVDGVGFGDIADTFGAPRDGGARKHRGVDIFARKGTPVRSAAWGVVLWKGELPLGGRVVYVLGRRGVLCYYAHLDHWMPGIHPGRLVSAGTVLGFVGRTGNAKTTPPHLHFSTAPLALGFTSVDPRALLRPIR